MAEETARVPVRSALLSKINWTNVVGMGCTLAVVAGCSKCGLSGEDVAIIGAAIQGVQTAATVVFRTWFNNSVSPASLGQ